LLEKHPGSQGTPMAMLTGDQIKDISHFLHQQVDNTLRSGPYTKVLNVMTGDAQAGAAYFEGAGGCGSCHSPTGDLAGIASKYDPPTLQQRLLFPRTVALGRGAVSAAKPVMVKVTEEGGESLSGTLVQMDDFNVALRDSAGNYHSWKRTSQLKVERDDPYAAHDELLDKLTDKDIHNLVTYLESLK
jgi:cytochrome c553